MLDGANPQNIESLTPSQFSENVSQEQKREYKEDLEIQKEKNSHMRQMNAASLGWIGKFFGDGKNTPSFAALISIIICFILIAINFFHQVSNLNSICSSIITLALGYLYGKST